MHSEPIEELTIRSLLGEPELEGLKLLAGIQAIDRPIRAVTVMDTPYIGNWLKGGELVLGSGFFLVNQISDVELVRSVAARGAAALGIKLSHFPQGLSEATVKAADEVGLPLLEVPSDWGWSKVIDCVLHRLGRQETKFLDLTHRVRERFVNLLLAGASPSELLRDLAADISRPVAMVNSTMETILFQSTPRGVPGAAFSKEEVSQAAARISAGDSEGVFSAPIAGENWGGSRVQTSAGSTVVVPVVNHGQPPSFILVREGTVPLSRDGLVQVAGAAAVLALGNRYAESEGYRERRDAFLFELLSGERQAAADIEVTGRYYGWSIGSPHTAFVGRILEFPADAAGGPQGGKASDTELLRDAAEVEKHILAVEPRAVIGRRGSLLFGLLPAAGARQRALDAVAVLSRAMTPLSPVMQRRVIFGVGRMSLGPKEFAYSFSLAEQALRLSEVFLDPGRVVSIDELAPYRLLWDLRERPETREVIDRVLGPVVDNPDDLYHTLRVFLDSGGHTKESAEQLFVHRNTLRARLDRIRNLTGLDPRQPRERLLLFLLVLVRKLMQPVSDDGATDPPPASPPGEE
ncbi:MAG TPA: PucR family transcriptional regulator ligand-binding domain-containing protein [Bacillota bacterium]|jgi:purine catabolism regulator